MEKLLKKPEENEFTELYKFVEKLKQGKPRKRLEAYKLLKWIYAFGSKLKDLGKDREEIEEIEKEKLQETLNKLNKEIKNFKIYKNAKEKNI